MRFSGQAGTCATRKVQGVHAQSRRAFVIIRGHSLSARGMACMFNARNCDLLFSARKFCVALYVSKLSDIPAKCSQKRHTRYTTWQGLLLQGIRLFFPHSLIHAPNFTQCTSITAITLIFFTARLYAHVSIIDFFCDTVIAFDFRDFRPCIYHGDFSGHVKKHNSECRIIRRVFSNVPKKITEAVNLSQPLIYATICS